MTVSNLIQPNDLYRLYVAIQKRPIFKTSRTPENIQIMFYTLYIYTCSIHVDNVWQPYIKLFFSKRNRRSFRAHDLSPNVFDIMIRKPRWPFPFMFFVSPKELTITMGTKTIDLSSFPWSLEVLGSLLNCLLCIHIYYVRYAQFVSKRCRALYATCDTTSWTRDVLLLRYSRQTKYNIYIVLFFLKTCIVHSHTAGTLSYYFNCFTWNANCVYTYNTIHTYNKIIII